MVTDTTTAIKKLDDLSIQLKNIRYNPDLHKIKKNIESMITELSKQEVIARRTKKSNHCQKILEEINQSVDYLEKLILVATIIN